MRALTSIQSATNVLADLEFRLQLSDQSTTFIFDRNDIVDLSPINWEIPYGGGFGRPSNYSVTLSTSVDFIKTYRKQMLNGTASLKVFVNSDNFVPTIGRVRNLTRFPADLNMLELQVYDKFLDSNPKVPLESIVDSYSVVHPEVINSDMGYPLYYGKHTRPFYMTPVNCDASIYLGPRNVSIANHVTSCTYNTDLTKGFDLTQKNLVLSRGGWEQQSSSTNTFSWATFALAETSFNDYNLFGYTNQEVGTSFNAESVSITEKGSVQVVEKSKYYSGLPSQGIYVNPVDYASRVLLLRITNKKSLPLKTTGGIQVSYDTDVNCFSSPNNWRFGLAVSDNGSYTKNSLLMSEGYTVTGSKGYSLTNLFNYDSYIWTDHITTTREDCIHTVSLQWFVDLKSSAYKNYSAAAIQVSCSDIAISENPMAIAADIIGQTTFNMRTAQNTQAQYDTSSYHFQCFMGERENLTDVLDEFGRTSAAYMWVGDSGFINFNTYQESATITNSALIAATVSTSDFLAGSLTIKDNPLGTTSYATRKASRFKVDYDFDFATGKYNQSNVAEKNNNKFCNSAYNAGIQTVIGAQTKYIKEAFTSSLYLQNLIRGATQDEQIIEMKLPARFFNLELTDVIKFQHPVLVGSESLFQITKINPDYLKGQVKITANEIINL